MGTARTMRTPNAETSAPVSWARGDDCCRIRRTLLHPKNHNIALDRRKIEADTAQSTSLSANNRAFA